MNHWIAPLTVAALLTFTGLAQSGEAPADDDGASAPPACLAKRTDPVFAAFEDRREEWERQYKRRRAEFHPKMMEHAGEIEKCVERALRRDLAANSRTTFGVHVGPDGRVAQVAVLESNHSNNLYGNCLVRTLCKIELAEGATANPEVFVFDFNMRRKRGPHQRPWSLDPRRMP